jgi:hypothetical protein
VNARSLRLMTAGAPAAGIRDLSRSAEPGGTFHYAFFKGMGRT